MTIKQSERNMYGCTPCPKCGGKHRTPYRNHPKIGTVIECGDCGMIKPWCGQFLEDGYSVDERES